MTAKMTEIRIGQLDSPLALSIHLKWHFLLDKVIMLKSSSSHTEPVTTLNINKAVFY